MNPWDFPLLWTLTHSLSRVLHNWEPAGTALFHLMTGRYSRLMRVQNSLPVVGKPRLNQQPPQKDESRSAESPSAESQWKAVMVPVGVTPGQREKVLLCHYFHHESECPKTGSLMGGFFIICQTWALLCLGIWKIIGEANWFPKVCAKNSSFTMGPCHVRLFLHSRCDARGASWHKMDESEMKKPDSTATSFNLF